MGERVTDSLHISERMWQDKVEMLALINGWLVDHKTPMRYASGHVRTTGLPGMPDLTLIHPAGHGFIMAELKTDKGRLSDKQKAVARALLANGVEYYVWRPSDLKDVEERLARWRKH